MKKILLFVLLISTIVLADKSVNMVQGYCGAYLRDDFNGPKLDMNKWEFWNSDPGVKIETRQGVLVIHGKTSKAGRAPDRDHQGFLQALFPY